MWNRNKQEQNKPMKAAFTPFLKPGQTSVLALQQKVDKARQTLTLQDELFTGYATNYETMAAGIEEAIAQMQTDPADAETHLRALMQALRTNAQTVRTQHQATMQVLESIGGRTNGCQ